MEKGKTKIVLSCDFGGYFATSSDYKHLYNNEELIELIEQKDHKGFAAFFKKLNLSVPPMEDLGIEEIEKGTKYYISEYDGSEGVVTEDQVDWKIA